MAQLKPLQTKQWLALVCALFVIVLIAHLTILTLATAQFDIQKADKITTFTTRMIKLPAIVPVVEKMSEVVSPPKPVKAVKPLKAKTEPALAPVLLPIPDETVASTVLAPAPPPAQPKAPVEVVSPEPALDTSTAASGEASPPPPLFTALSSGQHTYKVIFTKSGISNQGKADLIWRQDGEKYMLNLLASYTLLIKTFNVFEQNSRGQLSPQGLEPLRFSDKRLNRSEVATHFNRNLGKITFSSNTPDATLQAGAQDRLSVIWQLAGLLAANPTRYQPANTLTVQTVSATEAEPWLFTVNEPETLNLPTGSHVALRLTRNPRREFDQKIELWFATTMNYLPVRFRFTETNGDYVDVLWQSVQPLPAVLL
jgi:Protein of unknown function (DUF3108)